ncbi:hypothetical protein GGF50DRAFT_114649 [Schizophyllum commune]
MHDVLRTPELRGLIFSDVEEKKVLSSLARTCKDFLEPALGRLWHSVSLREFVLSLPEWKRPCDFEEKVTRDDITAEDVARMLFYGKFVRSLDLCDIDEWLCRDAVRALVRALSGQHVVPNIRTLLYDGSLGCNAIPAFISPSVNDITAVLSSEYLRPDTVQVAVRHFVEGTEELEQLDLEFRWDHNLNSLLQPLLTHWTTLSSLSVDLSHCDTATVLAIGALPRLEELAMTMRHASKPLPNLRDIVSIPENRTLKQLDLSILWDERDLRAYMGMGTDIIADLLAILRPTAVTTLGVNGRFGPDQLHHHCQSIGAYLSPPRLRSIALRTFLLSSMASIEDIRPLMGCHGLESLTLSDIGFHPTAGDIELMGKAWPNLRCLQLDEPRNRDSRDFTLSDLLVFAQNFPRLDELHLFLSASGIQAFDVASLPAVREHKSLRKLLVGNARIDEQAEVIAAFLAHFFPNLQPEGLRYGFYERMRPSQVPKGWSAMRELMQTLLDARRTEIHGKSG